MTGNGLRRAAAVVGIGHTDWVGDWTRARAGEKPADSYGYGLRALNAALGRFRAEAVGHPGADRRTHHRL